MHVLAGYADLYAQSVLINKISALELSWKLIKSALLVGYNIHLKKLVIRTTKIHSGEEIHYATGHFNISRFSCTTALCYYYYPTNIASVNLVMVCSKVFFLIIFQYSNAMLVIRKP